MVPRNPTHLQCSTPMILLSFSLLSLVSLSLFLFFSPAHTPLPFSKSSSPISQFPLRVYISDLPRSYNYGLLEKYWSLPADSRLDAADSDRDLRSSISLSGPSNLEFPPYPENPLIKQYSAEYWILGDLMTPEQFRSPSSVARRVFVLNEADVVLVPFFATLSAEMQLGTGKAMFGKKKEGNEDYERQREVVDFVRRTEAWKRSGGKDHVFVLTDPVAMWHVRAEIAPAILLVVDFGGWYRTDSKSSSSDAIVINNSSDTIVQHTQVSLLKDVIVPYTHLLPRLHLSENGGRKTLLYFKGAKHRHRGGLVREKLWDLLVNEPDVVVEEGFPNATGLEQSVRGMRFSDFCLHPAGDTPTSCRLFDAVISLCIPVIVSDQIELPFEGILDYTDFSIFVSTADALQPEWLVGHLRSFSKEQKDAFRRNMTKVQAVFEYDNGHPGGIGPVSPDGAVNHIWRKVQQKLPAIKEAIVREKRKPPDQQQ